MRYEISIKSVFKFIISNPKMDMLINGPMKG